MGCILKFLSVGLCSYCISCWNAGWWEENVSAVTSSDGQRLEKVIKKVGSLGFRSMHHEWRSRLGREAWEEILVFMTFRYSASVAHFPSCRLFSPSWLISYAHGPRVGGFAHRRFSYLIRRNTFVPPADLFQLLYCFGMCI